MSKNKVNRNGVSFLYLKGQTAAHAGVPHTKHPPHLTPEEHKMWLKGHQTATTYLKRREPK